MASPEAGDIRAWAAEGYADAREVLENRFQLGLCGDARIGGRIHFDGSETSPIWEGSMEGAVVAGDGRQPRSMC